MSKTGAVRKKMRFSPVSSSASLRCLTATGARISIAFSPLRTFSGRYLVRGDRLTFVVESPRENAGQTEKLKWSYYRGRLTLKIVDVADSGSRVIYTAHPWRKTGD